MQLYIPQCETPIFTGPRLFLENDGGLLPICASAQRPLLPFLNAQGAKFSLFCGVKKNYSKFVPNNPRRYSFNLGSY